MSFSRFVIIVFGIYVCYYTLMILYDVLYNSRKAHKESNELLFKLDLDDEASPIDVEEYHQETNHDDSSEKVEFDVETQGIPLEKLFADGKSVFANVIF